MQQNLLLKIKLKILGAKLTLEEVALPYCLLGCGPQRACPQGACQDFGQPSAGNFGPRCGSSLSKGLAATNTLTLRYQQSQTREEGQVLTRRMYAVLDRARPVKMGTHGAPKSPSRPQSPITVSSIPSRREGEVLR